MEQASARAPVHLWIVGALATGWYVYFTVIDYVMIHTHNQTYLAAFTEEQRAYFDAFPAWKEAVWAIGTWGALLGSLLLLVRSRFAVWAFALSFAGLAAATINHFMSAPSPSPKWLFDGTTIAMNVADWAIAIFLLLYAIRMRAQGVLR